MNAPASDVVARDVVEFFAPDLRWMGSEYGVAMLEALNGKTKCALDQIAERARRGGSRIDIELRITIQDGEAYELAPRHSGTEGTPEAGVAAGELGNAEPSGEETGPA